MMLPAVRFVTEAVSLAAVLVALEARPGIPQEQPKPREPAKPQEEQARPKQPKPESYGGTPRALVPYRRTKQVYRRFFEEPPAFRGAGRDKAPPPGLKRVKIGLLAPIEGGADADIGRSILHGVTLAFNEANAGGGYRGRMPYALVARNDVGLWGASSNALVDLAYREQVWAVIGSVDGANTHIALRVALKAEVVIVNTACTDPTLTETAIPWLLRCYPDDRQYGYRLARFVFTERNHRRVAVLRSNDKYGRMGVAEFTDAARRLGYPLVVEVRYAPGATDFSAQFDRIRKAGVEAVVLWSKARDAGRIVKAMRAAGMKHAVYGTDRLVSPAFLAEAGEAGEGVVAVSPTNPDRREAVWKVFRTTYRDAFGEEPDAFAAFSYDGTRLLLQAVDRGGLNRVRIRDALARITRFEGVSGTMRFDATHNNLGTIHVVQVREGRFAAVAGP